MCWCGAIVTAYSVCALTAAAVAVGLYRQLILLLFLSNKTAATTNMVLVEDLPGASGQRLADACVKIVRDSFIAAVVLVGVVELVC